MPSPSHKQVLNPRPAVDEWGIYDPEQAGLAAVLTRVEERRRAAKPEIDAKTAVSPIHDVGTLARKSRR